MDVKIDPKGPIGVDTAPSLPYSRVHAAWVSNEPKRRRTYSPAESMRLILSHG
jgi:hypothetical protein